MILIGTHPGIDLNVTDRQQRSLMRRDGLRDAAENAIEGVLPCGLEQIVRAGLDLMANSSQRVLYR